MIEMKIRYFLIMVGVFIFVVDFSIKASFFYHLPFLSKSGELFDFARPLFEIKISQVTFKF